MLHTALTGGALWVSGANIDILHMTIGAAIAFVLNFLASHYVPTTTGASALAAKSQ